MTNDAIVSGNLKSIHFKSYGRSTSVDTTFSNGHHTASTDVEPADELGVGTEDTIAEIPLLQGETWVAEDLRGIDFTPTPFAQPPHFIRSGRTQYYRGSGFTRPFTISRVKCKAGKNTHRSGRWLLCVRGICKQRISIQSKAARTRPVTPTARPLQSVAWSLRHGPQRLVGYWGQRVEGDGVVTP